MNRMRLVIVIGVILTMAACAGKVKEPTSPASPGAEFVEPEMEETEGIQGYQDVVLTAEDEQLVIPGATHGSAPTIKKRNKKSVPTNPSFWPTSDTLVEQMEGLEWGMTVRKVFSIFEQKIREKYDAEMSANSGDLLAEDRIRAQMLKELNKVKKSYVAFNGQTTGYESHMVDKEFTHNNNESMLVWDAGKYVEYIFFIDNRFWKRVRLFRIDKLGGITLDDFTGTMEAVLGCPGQEIMDEEGRFVKIAWRDKETFAAVIDGSKFFGVYGLRLSSAVTETHIAKLRVNKDISSGAVGGSVEASIDKAVSSVDMDDTQESVIDQYTGKSHTDGRFGSQHKSLIKEEKKEEKNEITKEEADSLF